MTLSKKKIIIIAGPSASGKTHLIKRLLTPKSRQHHRNLSKILGLNYKSSLGKLNIERLVNQEKILRRSKKMRKDAHLVHFDLTSKNQTKRRIQLKAIAPECKSIKVITVKLKFKIWKRRMNERVKTDLLRIPLSKAFWIYAISLISTRAAKKIFNSVYKDWKSLLDEMLITDRIIIDGETNQISTYCPAQDNQT